MRLPSALLGSLICQVAGKEDRPKRYIPAADCPKSKTLSVVNVRDLALRCSPAPICTHPLGSPVGKVLLALGHVTLICLPPALHP